MLPFQYDPRISIAVALGDAAHDFFKSEIGRYVLDRSAEEAAAANEKLLIVNPHETDGLAKVHELQNRYQVAVKAIAWLNDALMAGELASREALEGTELI